VVWVFTKEGRQLRCEVMRTAEPAAYQLIVTPPDRPHAVESIADPVTLVDRLAAVMLDLRTGGWQLA